MQDLLTLLPKAWVVHTSMGRAAKKRARVRAASQLGSATASETTVPSASPRAEHGRYYGGALRPARAEETTAEATEAAVAARRAASLIVRAAATRVGATFLLESPACRALRLALRPALLAAAARYAGLPVGSASGVLAPTRKRRRGGAVLASHDVASVASAASALLVPGTVFVAPCADALAETVDAVAIAAPTLEAYFAPACKPLRAAVAPMLEAVQHEIRGGPMASVEPAIRDMRVADALMALEEVRKGSESARQIKLGKLQRWVRDIDAWAGDPVLRVPFALRILDALLRIDSGLVDQPLFVPSSAEGRRVRIGGPGQAPAPLSFDSTASAGDAVRVGTASFSRSVDIASAPDRATASSLEGRVNDVLSWAPIPEVSEVMTSADFRSRVSQFLDDVKFAYRVLAFEHGPARTPPNFSDLKIFTTDVCGSSLLQMQNAPADTACTPVPGVPGAFVISNVLTPVECAALVAGSEQMGYVIDKPLPKYSAWSDVTATRSADGDCEDDGSRRPRPTNAVWYAEKRLNGELFRRCRPHLPQTCPTVGAGGAKANLIGLNARWRLYKSKDTATYRAHVDGWWPDSGLSVEGRYVYNAYPGERISRLTFVLYLTSQGIVGGETKFFTPHPTSLGTLEARGVQPRAGSVLCFPHGNAVGALVHEGARLFAGCKYIIRSDVMYTISKESRILSLEVPGGK